MEHSKVIDTDFYVISDDFRLLEFNQNVKNKFKEIQCGDLCYQATMEITECKWLTHDGQAPDEE